MVGPFFLLLAATSSQSFADGRQESQQLVQIDRAAVEGQIEVFGSPQLTVEQQRQRSEQEPKAVDAEAGIFDHSRQPQGKRHAGRFE